MPANVDTDVSEAEGGGRVVALRGELWRRHSSLRDLQPADAGYPDAVLELVALTEQLLAAEAEVSGAERAEQRRVSVTQFGWAGLAAAVFIVLVAVLPGLGGWLPRVVAGGLLVVVVATVLVVLRQRRAEFGRPRMTWRLPRRQPLALSPVGRSSAPAPRQAAVESSAPSVTEPDTGPLSVPSAVSD